MGRWIRWQGVVAFVVVAGLVAAVWFLLVDRAVERLIEQAGTAAVGAKVELDQADITLIPLGVTLSRLQVTNPDEPMTNAVEIARIAGSLDGLNLLRRKVIIEEVALDGVRFHTQRTTSGALTEQPKQPDGIPSKTGELFALPDIRLHDPKDILAKELDGLKSLSLADQLRAEVETEKEKWKQRIAELPDRAKLDEYKKRIEGLKSSGKGGLGGILGGVAEVQKIQEELKRDLDRLTGAKKDLEQTVASLKQRAGDIAKTPQEDVKRLMERYSLSGQGLANLTRALFAGPLAGYVETALRWHQRLEPLLSRSTEGKAEAIEVEVVKPLRGKGVDVRFKERAPLPDFLVRTARASVEVPAGMIRGTVKNITPDQPILGSPMTFSFAGEQLKGLESVTLDGTVNRVNRAKPKDTAQVKVAAYRLEHLGLGGEGAPVTLKQGLADLDVKASLEGRRIDATVGSRVRSVQMAVGGKLGAGPVGEAIAGALADIQTFRVNAEIAGVREQYEVRLDSDLDQVLKDAVGRQAKAQIAKLEGQLRAAIDEKVEAKLSDVRRNLGGFDPFLQDLVGRLNLGKDILKLGTGGIGGKSGLHLPF